MTQTHDQLYDSLRSYRERNALIRYVRDQLRGTGLDIRELAKELVISSPGHPERGRIYITYATGEISLRRTIWDYLGCLQGYGSGNAEPDVDAAKIIDMLAGHEGTPP
jgi:hypothetical protein